MSKRLWRRVCAECGEEWDEESDRLERERLDIDDEPEEEPWYFCPLCTWAARATADW